MKKKPLIFGFIAIALIAITTITAFAVSYYNRYNANINHYEITTGSSGISVTEAKDATLLLSNPGDAFDITYTIDNKATESYNYRFQLVNNETSTEDDILKSRMIYVYQNDEYAGVLYEFLYGTGANTKFISSDKYILSNEVLTEKLTFKLNNGASSQSITNTYSFKVRLQVETVQKSSDATIHGYSFVKTNNELLNVLRAVANGSINRTIVLGADVALAAPLTLSNDTTIDLRGHTLDLTNALTLKQSKLTIIDTKRSDSSNITGIITLNDKKSLIIPDESIKVAAFNNMKNAFDITNYDDEALVDLLVSRLNGLDYQIVNTDIDTVGYLSCYLTKGLTINDSTNGTIKYPTISNEYEVKYVTYKSNAIEKNGILNIVGNGTLDDIIRTELKHLYYYQSYKTNDPISYKDLTYDIYLPLSLKNHNINISWSSSDTELISNDGVISNKQGNAILTATIKYNNKVYVRKFFMRVAKEDNMSKLLYLASQIDIRFTDYVKPECDDTSNTDGIYFEDDHYYLPVANSDSRDFYTKWTGGKSLGIEKITYVKGSYNYLSYSATNDADGYAIDAAKLSLTKLTFDKVATIHIRAVFVNGEELEAPITVNIDLKNNPELIDTVYSYIQSYLDSVDVLENILTTRKNDGIKFEKGDFSVPSTYMQIDISYGVPTGVRQYEISDYDIIIKPEKFDLITKQIPITVNLLVDGTAAATRDLMFTIPGAITPENFKGSSNEAVFTDKTMRLFHSLKLQALQQSTDDALFVVGKAGAANITLDSFLGTVNESSNEFLKLSKYILLYDIENTQKLIFEYDGGYSILNEYDLSVFKSVFEWATGASALDIPDNVMSLVKDEFKWIKSDGLATLSDAEILIILEVCDKYPAFEYLFKNNGYISIGDNELTDNDISDLNTILTDKIIKHAIDWANDTTTRTLISYIESLGADTEISIDNSYLGEYLSSQTNDGTNTISNMEEQIILYIVYKEYGYDKYKAFYNDVWRANIKRVNDTATLTLKGTDVLTNVGRAETKRYRNVSTTEYNGVNVDNNPGVIPKVTLACYDPIFVELIKWMSEIGYDNSTESNYNYRVQDGSTTQFVPKSFKNIINKNEFTYWEDICNKILQKVSKDDVENQKESVYTSNWAVTITYYYYAHINYISPDEWNVLLAYVDIVYGIVPDKDTTDFITLDKESSSSKITDLPKSKKSPNLVCFDNNVGRSDNKYIYAPVFTVDYLNALIAEINSYYENTTGLEALFTWANEETNSLVSANTKLGSSVDSYNVYQDGFSTVSAIEWSIIDDYIANNPILPHVEGNNDMNTYRDGLVNLFKQNLDYNFQIPTDENNNPIRFDKITTKTVVSYFYPSFDKLDAVISFIKGVDSISTKELNGTSYTNDRIPTISFDEYKYLCETFKDNQLFINRINELITAYNCTLTNGVLTFVDNTERTFTTNEYKELYALIINLLGGSVDSSGNSASTYIYITIPVIDDDYLKCFDIISSEYFSGLSSIKFMGNMSTALTTEANANILFAKITNVSHTLERVVFNYTNLSDISGSSLLSQIQYVDLAHNNITDFADLQYIGKNEKGLLFLNLHDNKNNEVTLLPLLNFLYKKSKKNNNDVYYFYDAVINKNKVYSRFTSSDSEALTYYSYLYRLNEIEKITYKYYQLPSKIYIDGNTATVDVTWYVDGKYRDIIVKDSTINRFNISGNGTVTIEARINVNGKLYIRYFEVTLSI